MKRKLSAVTALFLLFAVVGLHAQGDESNFSFPFTPNSLGTEFYAAAPANWDLPGSTAYYIRLYITSPVETQVKVWAGGTLKKVITTRANDIVTVDLSALEAQMLVRNDQPPVPNDRIYQRKAIRLKADAPIAVYLMNRTTYTSDGMLLLPVSALGKQYTVASYGAVIGVTQELPSQYMIIAPHNNTQVTICNPMRTPNHAAGETFTINLDKGDVFSAMTVGYGGDMTGATITSNKPIAVTAGQSCTYIPNLLNFCCCDHITEMMLPMESWGKDYLAVPFATRLKGDFYRVMARRPNTKVYINGVEYATLSEAECGEEGTSWFEYRALGKGLVQISADKPIDVFQYNPSQAYDNVPSDPFYMAITPQEQFSKEIFFCTPAADFPVNYMNIVFEKEDFDNLEIREAKTNAWKKVKDLAGTGVRQNFPEKVDGRDYSGVHVELKPGIYHMRSHRPFAAYLYGFSSYDSYGYPTAAFTSDLDIQDLTLPDIAAVVAGCSGVANGVASSNATFEGEAIALSSVTLEPYTSTNYTIEVSEDFQAGVSTTASYMLRPVDMSKPAIARVVASDIAGNVIFNDVNYVPGQGGVELVAHADDVVFSSTSAGTTATKATLLYQNGTEAVTISEIVMKDGSVFKLKNLSLPQQLDPSASLAIDVEFMPQAEGTFMDSVIVREQCGGTYAFAVQGEASGPIAGVITKAEGVMSSMNVAPNPATGDETILTFSLKARSNVSAMIVDASGREVRSIPELKSLNAGEQTVKLDLAGLAAGRYFVRVMAGEQTLSAPLVLVR